MAAASIVIKALPISRRMTMYIDSIATIQALDPQPLSERRRIKSQGRAWKSFVRPTLAEKWHQITISHVKSHCGLETPYQQGNDQADKMAKRFMSGEDGTCALFYRAEERFLASQGDTLVGGNIRMWLKGKESEQLESAWRKLKVQGQMFRRFPQQIKKGQMERHGSSSSLLSVTGSH